jgi:hypothetical protein
LIKRFFRWKRWRARAKYYQRRVVELESALATLTDGMEAEVMRNRAREDTFVSAAIMGMRGMFGVPPRTGPALQRPSQSAQPLHSPDPFDTILTGVEKMEFQTIVLPDAMRAGVSEAEARRHFLDGRCATATSALER